MPWTLTISNPRFQDAAYIGRYFGTETFPTWKAATDAAETAMSAIYSRADSVLPAALGRADVALMEAIGRVAEAESDGEAVSIRMAGYVFDIARAQSRGAPMGRVAAKPATVQDHFELYRVRLNRGGYDSSGAYWGIGAPLYHYAGPGESEEGWIRAADRGAAKAKVLASFPAATFYR